MLVFPHGALGAGLGGVERGVNFGVLAGHVGVHTGEPGEVTAKPVRTALSTIRERPPNRRKIVLRNIMWPQRHGIIDRCQLI